MTAPPRDVLGQAAQYLRDQRPDRARDLLSALVASQPDLAGAWHLLGEAEQRCGDLAAAEAAFRKVIALEPHNRRVRLALGIVLRQGGRATEAETVLADGAVHAAENRLKAAYIYNQAFAQHDQGRKQDALDNLSLCRMLDPGNNAIDLSRADLLEEMARYDEAEALLAAMLEREPENVAAHAGYNHLMHRLGRADSFLKSYDRAPATPELQLGKANFLLKTGQAEAAHALYAPLIRQDRNRPEAVTGAALALGQLGRHGEAVTLLEQALRRNPGLPLLHMQLAEASLQAGDPQKAAAMADQGLKLSPLDQHGWALLGSAWRVMGDARDEHLNGYDDLIQIFDLEPPEGFASMADFNAELTGWLEQIHPRTREPLHQSLRGGSQTRGAIFNPGNRLAEKLKHRIAQAVQHYIASTRQEGAHPFRGRAARGFRFTGSWSSRLGGCGYHVNHVHPLGWISSCYYAGVPDAAKDEAARQGWITFGEPSFDIGLGIRRAIQPLPGRLVLFPSYMWHGTIPFQGPSLRTTIAFDAVPD